MKSWRSLGEKCLTLLPAIVLMTLANVFICFSSAGVVLLQLITNGVERYLSLGIAILIAIGVHFYLMYNHKIREYIKQGAKNE